MKYSILILLFIVSLGYSIKVYVTPQDYYYNNCLSGDNYGIGYVLPVGTCIQINSNYLKIDLASGLNIVATWYADHDCTGNSTAYSYSIGTCTSFTVPDSDYYLSTISLIGSIPKSSIVYNNYYQSSNSCEESYFSVYYTDDYSEYIGNQNEIQYYCNNSIPHVNTCNKESGSCDPTVIDPGCQKADSTHPYPYSVSCSN